MKVEEILLIFLIFTFSYQAMGMANRDRNNSNNIVTPTSKQRIQPSKIISSPIGSNELLVGYDCQNPHNIQSHKMDSLQDCETLVMERHTKSARMQILQESKTYTNKGIVCLLTLSVPASFSGRLVPGGRFSPHPFR